MVRRRETPPGTADLPVALKYNGVDCLAQYWLNGELIGASDNMLIEVMFEVGGKLRPGGRNELAVRLSPPLRHAMEQTYGPGMAAQPTNWERLHVRKAGHMYGWDIMPRALSAGIWRGVELVVQEREAASIGCSTARTICSTSAGARSKRPATTTGCRLTCLGQSMCPTRAKSSCS